MAVPKAWRRALLLLAAAVFAISQLWTPAKVELPANPAWALEVWSADDCSRPGGYWPFRWQVPVSLEGAFADANLDTVSVHSTHQ